MADFERKANQSLSIRWQWNYGLVAFRRMQETPVAPKQQLSKAKVFLRRLLSSIVLWSVVIGSMFSGNKPLSDGVFLVIMMALAGFGLAEFYGLVEKRGLICFKHWGVTGGLLLIASTFFYLSGALG